VAQTNHGRVASCSVCPLRGSTMHGHAKWGYKERQYIDPCVQCINTNINVYPLPTAVQNIYLFCVSPNSKINRDVEGDVAGWKCKLCANESGWNVSELLELSDMGKIRRVNRKYVFKLCCLLYCNIEWDIDTAVTDCFYIPNIIFTAQGMSDIKT